MATTTDVLVIGVGGFGAATLAALAERGVNCLGLDQYGPQHALGSSHGESRIIRQAYFEHPDYVPLLQRAYAEWERLEQLTTTRLLDRCGLLLSGSAKGPTIAGARLSAAEHGIPLDIFDAETAQRRFPMFTFPEDHAVAFEANAGLLAVERCVAAHCQRAAECGAMLHWDEPVVRWSANQQGVRVETSKQRYQAARLIITAGAWASSLMTEWWGRLRVLRKVVTWQDVNVDQQEAWTSAPCYFFEEADAAAGPSPKATEPRALYGFPCRDGQTLKIGEHSGGEVVPHPSLVDRDLRPADVAPLAEFVRRRLHGVRPKPRRYSVCLYTMSPDGHFIIDRSPESERVTFACGFSGHGFKFTAALGPILADLALEGRTDAPIEFLSQRRFAAL